MINVIETNIERYNMAAAPCYYVFSDTDAPTLAKYVWTSQDQHGGGLLSEYRHEIVSAQHGGEYVWDFAKVNRFSFIDKSRRGILSDLSYTVDYSLVRSWEAPTGERCYILNGAKSSNFLTGKSTLIRYEGYPLNVGIRTANTQSLVVNRTIYTPNNAFKNSGAALIHANTNGAITANFGEGAESIQVVSQSVDTCSPYYLRWINEYGGYDYYLFGDTYKVVEYQDAAYFRAVSQRFGGRVVLQQVPRKSEQITAKSRTESGAELEALMYIPHSPKIQHYNEQSRKWELVLIMGGSYSYAVQGQPQQLTFQFLVPEL